MIKNKVATCNEIQFKFLNQAQECASAADLLQRHSKTVFFSIYFLLGRAIELALKAYLLNRGYTVDMLRKKQYGHNLIALFDKAVEEELKQAVEIEILDRSIIQILNIDYSTKRLEYNDGGEIKLPDILLITRFTNKLITYLKSKLNQ